MINFRKSGLNHQKPQFEKFGKSQWNAWIYAWKHEIKCKRKGKMDLPAWREENLAKRQIENDKKNEDFPWPSRMEREKGENFLKKCLTHLKNCFKKCPTQFSIDQNLRFDRSKQTEAHSKILNQFRLIKKQPRSIEIPKKTQFWKKPPCFCINSSKHWKYEQNAWVWDAKIFRNTSFKPSYPKFKIFKHSS